MFHFNIFYRNIVLKELIPSSSMAWSHVVRIERQMDKGVGRRMVHASIGLPRASLLPRGTHEAQMGHGQS